MFILYITANSQKSGQIEEDLVPRGAEGVAVVEIAGTSMLLSFLPILFLSSYALPTSLYRERDRAV